VWPCWKVVPSAGRPEEGGRHLLGGQGGGQGQIAAGQALGQAEEVGRHPLALAGEQTAGLAEADGHLVGDQQGAVAAGDLPQPAQVALGMDDDARGALHQGLDDDRRHLAGVGPQDPIDLRQAGDPALGPLQPQGTAVAVRARRPQRGEQQGGEHRVEPIDAADADVADRVAMIRRVQGQEPGAPRLGVVLLPPVLERHLEGDLDGRRPVVGEEDAGQALGCAFHQAPVPVRWRPGG
jgi:hypothetical protein